MFNTPESFYAYAFDFVNRKNSEVEAYFPKIVQHSYIDIADRIEVGNRFEVDVEIRDSNRVTFNRIESAANQEVRFPLFSVSDENFYRLKKVYAVRLYEKGKWLPLEWITGHYRYDPPNSPPRFYYIDVSTEPTVFLWGGKGDYLLRFDVYAYPRHWYDSEVWKLYPSLFVHVIQYHTLLFLQEHDLAMKVSQFLAVEFTKYEKSHRITIPDILDFNLTVRR